MIADAKTIRGSLTQETLSLMQDLTDEWCKHPFMVQLAREICSYGNALSPLEEDRAIHDYITSHIVFRHDPVGTEWVQDPLETLVNSQAGDCDDFSVVAGTLLQAIGHYCSMAAVKWSGRSDFSHAVCFDELTGAVVDGVEPDFENWPPKGLEVSAFMRSR
jgi:hypothetical protein